MSDIHEKKGKKLGRWSGIVIGLIGSSVIIIAQVQKIEMSLLSLLGIMAIATLCTSFAIGFMFPPKVPPPFLDRITEAGQHMEATGKLLQELEDELSTRTCMLEQLQSDAEYYERLTSLNAEQAKVIEDMVGQQFKRQSRATWWQWWSAIILAAILGFIVNWASSPLWDWLTR